MQATLIIAVPTGIGRAPTTAIQTHCPIGPQACVAVVGRLTPWDSTVACSAKRAKGSARVRGYTTSHSSSLRLKLGLSNLMDHRSVHSAVCSQAEGQASKVKCFLELESYAEMFGLTHLTAKPWRCRCFDGGFVLQAVYMIPQAVLTATAECPECPAIGMHTVQISSAGNDACFTQGLIDLGSN